MYLDPPGTSPFGLSSMRKLAHGFFVTSGSLMPMISSQFDSGSTLFHLTTRLPNGYHMLKYAINLYYKILYMFITFYNCNIAITGFLGCTSHKKMPWHCGNSFSNWRCSIGRQLLEFAEKSRDKSRGKIS